MNYQEWNKKLWENTRKSKETALQIKDTGQHKAYKISNIQILLVIKTKRRCRTGRCFMCHFSRATWCITKCPFQIYTYPGWYAVRVKAAGLANN